MGPESKGSRPKGKTSEGTFGEEEKRRVFRCEKQKKKGHTNRFRRRGEGKDRKKARGGVGGGGFGGKTIKKGGTEKVTIAPKLTVSGSGKKKKWMVKFPPRKRRGGERGGV